MLAQLIGTIGTNDAHNITDDTTNNIGETFVMIPHQMFTNITEKDSTKIPARIRAILPKRIFTNL